MHRETKHLAFPQLLGMKDSIREVLMGLSRLCEDVGCLLVAENIGKKEKTQNLFWPKKTNREELSL